MFSKQIPSILKPLQKQIEDFPDEQEENLKEVEKEVMEAKRGDGERPSDLLKKLAIAV